RGAGDDLEGVLAPIHIAHGPAHPFADPSQVTACGHEHVPGETLPAFVALVPAGFRHGKVRRHEAGPYLEERSQFVLVQFDQTLHRSAPEFHELPPPPVWRSSTFPPRCTRMPTPGQGEEYGRFRYVRPRSQRGRNPATDSPESDLWSHHPALLPGGRN